MKKVTYILMIVLSMTFSQTLQAKEYKVGQKDKRFSPSELKLKVGDSIEFANDDRITHNVFSRSPGNQFNVNLQQPGTKSKVTLKHAGKVEVRCAIHPKMKMIVSVEP